MSEHLLDMSSTSGPTRLSALIAHHLSAHTPQGIWLSPTVSTWNTAAMSYLLPDAVVVEAYRDLRRRMIELLRETPPQLGASPVPHCPAWSVRDVAAHLVGVPEDILAGRMEGVTTEAWTQAQVDRHLDQSLADLADIWANQIESFDAVLPHIPAPVNSQMVMDAVTHEHDIRHALGKAGARDSSAVRVGLGWLLDAAGDETGLADPTSWFWSRRLRPSSGAVGPTIRRADRSTRTRHRARSSPSSSASP
jgi:uncharacterized protein (TIGR03083 family)